MILYNKRLTQQKKEGNKNKKTTPLTLVRITLRYPHRHDP